MANIETGLMFRTSKGASKAPPAVPLVNAESEMQFFSRRASEEARLAVKATCPTAAAAHRYLAAAYAARVKHEIDTAASLDSLAREIF